MANTITAMGIYFLILYIISLCSWSFNLKINALPYLLPFDLNRSLSSYLPDR